MYEETLEDTNELHTFYLLEYSTEENKLDNKVKDRL